MKPVKKKTKPKKKQSRSKKQAALVSYYDNEMALAQIIKQLGAILTEIKFVSQHIIEQITKGRDPLLPAIPTSVPEPSKPQVLPKEPIDWFRQLENRRKQEADKRKQIDPWIDYPNLPNYPNMPKYPYEPLKQPIITCNTPNPLS